MLVSTRRNDSFPKRERRFPQAGTTVSSSGNDGFLKWGRQFPQVGTAVSSSGNCHLHQQPLRGKEVSPVTPMDRTFQKKMKDMEMGNEMQYKK